MDIYLTFIIFVCICASIGFIYGIIKFLQPKKALYAQMITFSTGCLAFGNLYQIVRLITGADIIERFHIGVFGVIGSLLFLFSANYGTIDSLADDGSKELKKYRLIPLIAPAILIIVYVVFVLIMNLSLLLKVITGIIIVIASLSSYFNLKHLILPDIDFGVIKCLRTYNAVALIYTAGCVLELLSLGYNNEVLFILSNIIIGITVLIMVPVVERGQKKWTT